MNEFSIISQFFTQCGHSPYVVNKSIGDDAAIVSPPTGLRLVMTMDTLIEDVHFPSATPVADIAHKALAVNVSDLAAMGAQPAWFLLSLSLPQVDTQWLTLFSDSLKQQADRYAIQLIGGDTCKGPLSITIQATGIVTDKAILRSTAQVGDVVLVSGELGKAALGLAHIQQQYHIADDGLREQCIQSLNAPTARLDVASIVSYYATSMIDISDGLLGDLGHILKASDVGAELYLEQIPMPSVINTLDLCHYALTGGDDYELCFTLPKLLLQQVMDECHDKQIEVSVIGQITQAELKIYDNKTHKKAVKLNQLKGFQHFE